MKEIVVVPSDKRQEYVLEYFKDRDYSCRYMTNGTDIAVADAVILPIPSEIDGKIKSTDLSCKEFVRVLKENCVVFGFCMSDTVLAKELKKRNITFFDVYESGELAVANAYATAQGVLGFILRDTEKMMREIKILVSGYGKTGRAICETLSANKAQLTVLARRAEYRSELCEKNIESCSYREENLGSGYDYIINTVASRVVDGRILETLNKDGKILEIASKPYGVDFEKAEEMDLHYEILPSLPSKAAPKSAGRFMACAIEKIIEENREEGKTWKR